MATRIVPVAEVNERLGSLDMASPVIHRQKVEKWFLKFVESLKVSQFAKGLPPVTWLDGLYDHRRKLLGAGIFPSDAKDWWGALHRYLSPIDQVQGRSVDPTFINPIYATTTAPSSVDWPPGWRGPVLFYDDNFLRAFEEGLGYWLVSNHSIVLIPRPGLRVRQERTTRVLHSMISPAVRFPKDPASDQFWIRGVRVPEFVVMHPERITRAHIRAARSPVVRRTLIDQYGLLKYAQERGYKQVDRSDHFGATLYVKGGNPSSWTGTTQRECVVELVNSTPEPDGTYRHFARRVPGQMTNAHQAVAWTFGFNNAAEYKPVVQT